MSLHLLKLCVGVDSLDDLRGWQERRGIHRPDLDHAGKVVVHVTRNMPRRAAAVLDGGSLYWVVRGRIACRNPILALEEIEGEDGKRRCAVILAAGPVPVVPRRHRPFQGWRYFTADAVPPDLEIQQGDAAGLPAEMAAELRELGLL
jgi:hypothetical protein